MGYLHVDILTYQSPKRPGEPCGDVIGHDRQTDATALVCSDGLGSGIKANIAATMCVSRLLESLRCGLSLREAFASLVRTMNYARDHDLPYAVFTVVRIRNSGEATVLGYEMPAPLLISGRRTSLLNHRSVTVDRSVVSEALCHLRPGEGILCVSDGVTQAGLGAGLAEGWQTEGLQHYVDECLAGGISLDRLPRFVHHRARELWNMVAGDDCTVSAAVCRQGKCVTVLTGPPAVASDDNVVVSKFTRADGVRLVCGATTARIVSRCMGRRLSVEQDNSSPIAPPKYAIEGIDLVTEGAITLNQVNNIFDENPAGFEKGTGVTSLWSYLHAADRVDFLVGRSLNPANDDILFRQQGILPRSKIVPLLAERLRQIGKLVTIEHY
ncbi:MAG: SpoIIE family protein phosphatase [Phycisphaerales bacterium]|nr:SpoIIE family protein phosphatase [Phycisphaerales bacterium]